MSVEEDIKEIWGMMNRVSTLTLILIGPMWWIVVSVIEITIPGYFYGLYSNSTFPTFLMTFYSLLFAGLIVSFSIAAPGISESKEPRKVKRFYVVSTYYGILFTLGLITLGILCYLFPPDVFKNFLVLIQIGLIFFPTTIMALAIQDLREFVIKPAEDAGKLLRNE